MPELPEVETVRRGLAPVLEHHAFTSVSSRRAKLRAPLPPRFAERLTGRKVARLRRRAKYLLADLDNGETLVIHLGMSGRLSVFAEGRARTLGRYFYDLAPIDAGRGKHDHVVLRTDTPARIVFTDHRRFGLITLLPTRSLDDDPLFKGLGIEPLSDAFDAAYLEGALRGKKTPIKSALLDQRVIAGIGNIYACEALFRARISPKRLTRNVRGPRAAALVDAIKTVLEEALAAGGSSLRDYAKTDGRLGEFQHRFAVYGGEGRPCPRCKKAIRRIVQSGRSTFYCPNCQR